MTMYCTVHSTSILDRSLVWVAACRRPSAALAGTVLTWSTVKLGTVGNRFCDLWLVSMSRYWQGAVYLSSSVVCQSGRLPGAIVGLRPTVIVEVAISSPHARLPPGYTRHQTASESFIRFRAVADLVDLPLFVRQHWCSFKTVRVRPMITMKHYWEVNVGLSAFAKNFPGRP